VPPGVETTAIPEVRFIRPLVHRDERGWFLEVMRAAELEELGLTGHFAQVNQSRSRRGVIRGLHLQWDPPQAKLMRVVAGRAFLVAVDARPGSPTLGRLVTLEASADDPVFVSAPASFARGFAALEDDTEVEYFMSAPYDPAHEAVIRWDDPALGIAWPVDAPVLSAKDASAGTLADWLARPEASVFAYQR